MPLSSARAATLVAFSLVTSTVAGAGEFATSVVQFLPGPGATPAFPVANLLGGPEGGGLHVGSLDVCVLGEGGAVTLGFDVVIQDGPGADFMAFENAFQVAGGGGAVFAEPSFVEVSSDGVTFARFPSRYHAASGAKMGSYAGLCGGMPVLANVLTNSIPAEDPVRAGGEAFDLVELLDHPLVGSGAVDLSSIRFVRLVDVLPGESDTAGNPIQSGGASDPDAVAVINHTGTVTAGQPICDLEIDVTGALVLRLGDPNGFADLDLGTLRASFDLVEFPFFAILPVFVPTSFDGTTYELKSIAPVMGQGITGAFAMSVEDWSGGFSGDQVMVQG